MRSNGIILSLLAFFALLEGYLLSSVSFVGRFGINVFYKEYRFLKIWWQDALITFVCWILIYFTLSFLKKSQSSKKGLIKGVFFLVALAGLVFSYSDFRNSISHRLLGERFHLGVYLFWLVWMGLVIVNITRGPGRSQQPDLADNLNKSAGGMQ